MFVTYKLSEKSLDKLQKKGISEAALNDLAEMENQVLHFSEIIQCSFADPFFLELV